MSFSRQDQQMMIRALVLARNGLYTTQPNPRVGCVITKDDQIVGEGYHVQSGGPHAEVHALRAAGDLAAGSTAYVTLEPCSHFGKTPPCANALLEAGVARVVAAMQDPNPQVAGQGLARLAQAGVQVQCGLMEAQAGQINPGFIKLMEQGLPWVRVKLAMSLDGRTAMASGESQWITGAAARLDVQKLRARSAAVLTGVGTVLQDDPSMNVRLTAEDLALTVTPPQPVRVILDSSLRTPPSARILTLAGQTLIFHHHGDARRAQALKQAGAELVQVPASPQGLDLRQVLATLAERGINEVHVEAGAVLSGALLQAGLVDELVIYMAAHIMGDQAKGLFHLPGLQRMADRQSLHIQDIRPIGQDWRITAYPADGASSGTN